MTRGTKESYLSCLHFPLSLNPQILSGPSDTQSVMNEVHHISELSIRFHPHLKP